MTSTPYSTAVQLIGTEVPTWLNEMDAQRLASYALYEDIYWTKPDTFKLVTRGTDDLPPIYLPSGRIIVNTMNRYVAKGFQWIVDPAYGTDSSKALAMDAFNRLFKRERFKSKFNSNRLYGLIRGDSCWFIVADGTKPEGERIDIHTLDPGSYFPIDDPNDLNSNLGVDIIEQLLNGEDVYIKRQRYMKPKHPEHPNPNSGFIARSVEFFELEGWEDPEKVKKYRSPLLTEVPLEVIDGITKVPVYHVKNFEEPENPFGASEMRGLERMFGAINQTISDEDVAIALQGLGVYWTDSGAPVDANGNDSFWNIGPGEVVEVGVGRKFGRVSGVASVEPSQAHADYLQDQAFRVTGASDVAQGQVSVEQAESGIALKLRLGPILDESAVKDDLMTEVMDNMFHDLREWLMVYENINVMDTEVVSLLGDKLPSNKDQKFKDLLAGLTSIPQVWSGQYVREELQKDGWDIPENELERIGVENLALAEMSDPTGQRQDAEVGGDPIVDDTGEPA